MPLKLAFLLILCLMGIFDTFAQNKNVAGAISSNIPIKKNIGPRLMTDIIEKIDAPFSMPQLQRPQFPNRGVLA